MVVCKFFCYPDVRSCDVALSNGVTLSPCAVGLAEELVADERLEERDLKVLRCMYSNLK